MTKSTLISDLSAIVGKSHVLEGPDAEPWGTDWTGAYKSVPSAVTRPANVEEVSAIVRYAAKAGVPIVPISGRTGLAGGALSDGAIMLWLGRMNKVREIRSKAQVMVVEAGVTLSEANDAANAHDLSLPLSFGAKESAMIGGALATNAGGSNVLRHGNARALCLGLEAVLPNGEILSIMSALKKDNSGYNLRDLLIGAEGTLGIITAATMRLVPTPQSYATAMVALASLNDALDLMNRLQSETTGALEACEYMPRFYIEEHLKHFTDARPPFEKSYDHNLLVELASSSVADSGNGGSEETENQQKLEKILAEFFENGTVLDAVIAQNGKQRSDMWKRREVAAEIALSRENYINNDIAVPLDSLGEFLTRAHNDLHRIDPGAQALSFAHLGDGNVHYTVWPSSGDATLHREIAASCEGIANDLGGSFSAEHGVGTAKLAAMQQFKDPVAIETMRAIKTALDPLNIMNPGKVVPARD